jgi:hypothetical protein
MLLVCATVAALPLTAMAEDAPKRKIISLSVQGMRAPTPALRYTLLPDLKALNPGNPIQGYMKCFMESEQFFYQTTAVSNRYKWKEMPLKELPLKELHDYGGDALRQADYAARLDTPDWQVLPRLKSAGIRLLLPELQQMRRLEDALMVRCRVEIAGRRFDDAIRTAQTILALARHIDQHPTLIGSVVSMSVTRQSADVLMEMAQQPDCPNLYWALTDLPSPFIDLRQGMQGESLVDGMLFAPFDTTTPLTPAQLTKVLQDLDQLYDDMQLKHGLSARAWPLQVPRVRAEEGVLLASLRLDDSYFVAAPPFTPAKTPTEWVKEKASDDKFMTGARKRLVEAGYIDEVVKKLPAQQIVLLDEKRWFEADLQDVTKMRGLPIWIADAAPRASKHEREQWLFSRLSASVSLILQNRGRVEQRLALLRQVEAIRLYAAEKGTLPSKLSDITVPLPVDPFTGQPFYYAIDGEKAVLRGRPPRGRESQAEYNLQLEVTLRK